MRGYSKIALLGESFGGLVSLFAYDENISAVALWGPVTGSRVPSFLKDKKLKVELEEDGHVIYKTDGRDHLVTQEYIDSRGSIDREALLSRIKCPVLIVHGNCDNQVSYEESEGAMRYFSGESDFILIKDGKHSLDNKIDKAIGKTRSWLVRYLK